MSHGADEVINNWTAKTCQYRGDFEIAFDFCWDKTKYPKPRRRKLQVPKSDSEKLVEKVRLSML